jgi:hypothetical protein
VVILADVWGGKGAKCKRNKKKGKEKTENRKWEVKG